MFCEKCGFEYSVATCPVCEIEERERAERIIAQRSAQSEQATQPSKKKSSLGLYGMLTAIASFVLNFIIPIGVPDLLIAIAGLIMSIIGKKKNGKDGCATAGILISVARIVIDVISTVFVTVCGILLTVFYFAVETGLSLFIDKLFESLLSLL